MHVLNAIKVQATLRDGKMRGLRGRESSCTAVKKEGGGIMIRAGLFLTDLTCGGPGVR